jgi:hypothetical protein
MVVVVVVGVVVVVVVVVVVGSVRARRPGFNPCRPLGALGLVPR